jgi:lipoprotein Spr
MNSMNKKYFAKSVVGVTLSLAVLFSGSTLLTAQPAHAATVSASTTASNIIATGERFMGVPYQWGAKSGRTDRFDCSSFTQYVFKQNGIAIPRDSRQQSRVGTYVDRNNLQPGDLVFFYSPIHHVAIYMGNGKLLHTFGKAGVTITDFSGWWSSHYNTARRVLPTVGQGVPVSNPQPTTQPVSHKPSPTKAVPSKHSFVHPLDENQEGNH